MLWLNYWITFLPISTYSGHFASLVNHSISSENHKLYRYSSFLLASIPSYFICDSFKDCWKEFKWNSLVLSHTLSSLYFIHVFMKSNYYRNAIGMPVYWDGQIKHICVCSTTTDPTCGCYCSYVERNLVTVSGRERITWRDQQS